MSGFSRIVLEHSVRLALEAIPPERDARAAECVRDIRRYLRWMEDESSALDYRDHLRDAVSELSGIALMHRELSIADRLQDIVEQLTVQRLLAIHESRREKEKRKKAILRLLLG